MRPFHSSPDPSFMWGRLKETLMTISTTSIPQIIPLRQVPSTSTSTITSTESEAAATTIREEPIDPRVRWAKESVLRTAESHRLSLNSKIARWRKELGMPGEEKSAEHLTLIARLKQIEWGGRANKVHFICPACGASQAIGHEIGCWLGEVLA